MPCAPDVVSVLERSVGQEPEELAGLHPDTAIYVVSIPIPRLTRRGSMARWRQRLFLLLDRLTSDHVEQLARPRERSITVGREVDL